MIRYTHGRQKWRRRRITDLDWGLGIKTRSNKVFAGGLEPWVLALHLKEQEERKRHKTQKGGSYQTQEKRCRQRKRHGSASDWTPTMKINRYPKSRTHQNKKNPPNSKRDAFKTIHPQHGTEVTPARTSSNEPDPSKTTKAIFRNAYHPFHSTLSIYP